MNIIEKDYVFAAVDDDDTIEIFFKHFVSKYQNRNLRGEKINFMEKLFKFLLYKHLNMAK